MKVVRFELGALDISALEHRRLSVELERQRELTCALAHPHARFRPGQAAKTPRVDQPPAGREPQGIDRSPFA
jgi:hypothetical protein